MSRFLPLLLPRLLLPLLPLLPQFLQLSFMFPSLHCSFPFSISWFSINSDCFTCDFRIITRSGFYSLSNFYFASLFCSFCCCRLHFLANGFRLFFVSLFVNVNNFFLLYFFIFMSLFFVFFPCFSSLLLAFSLFLCESPSTFVLPFASRLFGCVLDVDQAFSAHCLFWILLPSFFLLHSSTFDIRLLQHGHPVEDANEAAKEQPRRIIKKSFHIRVMI